MRQYITFLIRLGLILLGGITINAHAAKLEPLDRIIAVINDTIITESELNQSIETIKKQMQFSNVPLPEHEVLHKQVLDRLINKKLQLQLAEHMGVNISEEELNKAINNIATNNKITIGELYQKLESQGIHTQDYRQEIKDELTLHQVQQKHVAPKVTITPQEVDAFMRSKAWQNFAAKEYHLEDILIALPEAPTPQQVADARKRAQSLLTKIRSGTDFKEVAAAESGETSALQGGDLGWRKLPEIPSVFAENLSNMKADDLIGPVQAPNGFHILRLAGVRSAEKQAAPSREQVQQLIFQRKFEENLHSWLTKLRSEAIINLNPEN